MPSSMTHSYFMQDVYNELDKDTKEKIVLEDAKTFAQGPDIFYFYNNKSIILINITAFISPFLRRLLLLFLFFHLFLLWVATTVHVYPD